MPTVVTGDLIVLAKSGIFDVIIHGCNCEHKMGAGIAKSIRAEFPEAYAADKATRNHISKLGSISHATTKSGLVVVNAYTQVYASTKSPMLSYAAVRSCFREIREAFGGRGLRFGYPKVGAGLAGGDWGRISGVIDKELAGENHTLVVLP